MKILLIVLAFAFLLLALLESHFQYTTAHHRPFSNEKPIDTSNYFQNKRGLWLHKTEWLPGREPTALLFVIHGFGEHCARESYNNVANAVKPLGVAMLCHDHQGFGKSKGERGFVNQFSDYADDSIQFIQQESKRWSNKPLFILGHSMGGLIVTKILNEHQDMFKGFIVTGTAVLVDPRVATPFLVRVSQLLHTCLPRLAVKDLSSKLMTRNSTASEIQKNDPLCYRTLHARTAYEILKATPDALINAPNIRIPALILHGGDDTVTEINGSRLLYEKLGTRKEDRHLVIPEGMFHELFQDPERAGVLEQVIKFIKKHY